MTTIICLTVVILILGTYGYLVNEENTKLKRKVRYLEGKVARNRKNYR